MNPVTSAEAWTGVADCLNCNIRQSVLFAGLSEAGFSDVHRPIGQLQYAAGATIYRSGDDGISLFTIRTGLVKLTHYLPDGGQLAGRDKIGLRVGKVIGKYLRSSSAPLRMAKHFDLDIQDAVLTFSVNEGRVAAEAALDGLYVIRTSAAEAEMSAEAAVLNYKRLAEVERAFRTLKGVDLQVRPIRHRLEERVKAHIFLRVRQEISEPDGAGILAVCKAQKGAHIQDM